MHMPSIKFFLKLKNYMGRSRIPIGTPGVQKVTCDRKLLNEKTNAGFELDNDNDNAQSHIRHRSATVR